MQRYVSCQALVVHPISRVLGVVVSVIVSILDQHEVAFKVVPVGLR